MAALSRLSTSAGSRPPGFVSLGQARGLVILLALLAAVGCDKASKPSADSAQAPAVQGELIRSSTPESTPATTTASVTPTVASSNSPTATASTPAPATKKGDEFQIVGFDKLSSYPFDVSDEILQSNSTNAVQVSQKTAEQIPATVRAFDKTRIALKGFMLPLKVEGGKVTEMLIMRDQSMCCYGAVPKINEWVSVKMLGGGVKPIMDQAITMYGKLHVGETRENGYLVGIYQMDGERIDVPSEN